MPARRHHYIPQMLLRNFADDSDALWFWRRGWEPRDVRRTHIKNLFVQGDLYSLVDDQGRLNDELERAFSSMEDTGADFMRQVLSIVRSGRTPVLEEAAWEFWFEFIYFQLKRAPGYVQAISDKADHPAELKRRIVEASAEFGEDPSSLINDQAAFDRLIRNSVVMATAEPPGEEIRQAFRTRGLAIFRAPSGKSFIVGDIPFARARVGEAVPEAPHGKVTFIPVAADIALGFLGIPRTVQVVTVGRDEARRMNEAMAAQSMLFASSSPALVRSLAAAVPYTGVTAAQEALAGLNS